MSIFTKLLIILVILSFAAFFYFHDTEKPPVKTNITAINPATNKMANYTMLNCTSYGKDYTLQQSKSNDSITVCFKPAPYGHTPVTIPQETWTWVIILLSSLFYGLGQMEFKSRKLLPCENKYQDELTPIPLHGDTYRITLPVSHPSKSPGFLRVRSGYDYISVKKNDFYIFRTDMVAEIGTHVCPGSGIQILSPREFFEYIGKDKQLARELLDDPNLEFENGTISKTTENITIYIGTPLPYDKLRDFLSIAGAYNFDADRSDINMKMCFKMRMNAMGGYEDLKKKNKQMRDGIIAGAEDWGVTSEHLSRARDSNIAEKHTVPEPPKEPENQ